MELASLQCIDSTEIYRIYYIFSPKNSYLEWIEMESPIIIQSVYSSSSMWFPSTNNDESYQSTIHSSISISQWVQSHLPQGRLLIVSSEQEILFLDRENRDM